MSIHGSVVASEPCPECGSRDNVKRYEDGYAKCFGMGCGWWEQSPEEAALRTDPSISQAGASLIEIEFASLLKRGISEDTCRKFRYGTGFKGSTPVQVAVYAPGVQKWRTADKKFGWINRPKTGVPLFGQFLWKGGKRLVVTEGEIDALSYAEVTNCSWPVVSVPDGASSAANHIAEHIEWVEGFDEVVFMFDMDEPGQKAAVACAELLTPGKARIACLSRKDANEVLLEDGSGELLKAPWNAKVYRPDGIVEGKDLIEAVLRDPEKGLAYPWPCLDSLMHGMRKGEMVAWIAGTGIGKSQIVREIAHHLWTTHGQRVGIVALEESTTHSALAQISLALDVPLHIAESRSQVDKENIRAEAERVLQGFAFYDHWGSVDAKVLLPKIKYMVHSMGIKWIVLDHLSIMVSGMATEGDERKRLDQLTTQLRSLCSELGIGLHVVSHLRKSQGTAHEEGGRVSLQDIRGSGAPAQLSDFVVALERNQQAEGEERDEVTLRVLKNRLSGQTGIAGVLAYDKKTGRLKQIEGEGTANGEF